MHYDSELQLAFSKSPSVLSEEQQELVLANPETLHLFWRIVDMVTEDAVVNAVAITAKWIAIRNILWPEMNPKL